MASPSVGQWRESLWWPGLFKDIDQVIKRYEQSIKESNNRYEPLIPSEFPKRAWQKVAMDLLTCMGNVICLP